MPEQTDSQIERYSCSLVTQGTSKFYSLTMPSEILAETCFVSTRDDDPKEGFQRILDETRAKEIAEYIDKGIGSIPTAIILSAQKEADFKYLSRNKTIEFKKIPKAFLVLDGQHRVYGFSLCTNSVRVPVIIYNGLTRKEETRLFIDINTKQRPVPTELLLDIKSLAEYESDIEAICRNIFDLFNDRPDSVLLGLLSSTTRSKGKISRVTFNASIKPIYNIFGDRDVEEVYSFLNSYLKAMIPGLNRKGINSISKPLIFRAVLQIFPHVARLSNGDYSVDSFSIVLDPLFDGISSTKVNKAESIKTINDHFVECLNKGFVL
jgi:DGQHR domain-containing protein